MRVVFRTDASRQIGTGHLARCLALADALQLRGVECCFVCRHIPDSYAEQLASRGFPLMQLNSASAAPAPSDVHYATWLGVAPEVDAAETRARLNGTGYDWLVVDHYALGAQWEQALRDSANRILVLDDLADRPHECDVLLDQNYHVDAEARYVDKLPQGCRMLLGPRYALLRREFQQARARIRPRSGTIHKVLVFFGGVDAANYTQSAVDALTRLGRKDLSVDVIIGALHWHRDELEASCKANGYTLYVQTDRMAELMAAADLGIGAGGSASWERCCVGLPCLTLAVADNQRRLVRDAARVGVLYAPAIDPIGASTLAPHLQALMENPFLLAGISQKGMDLVDGEGARRVLREMGVLDVTVRPAQRRDAEDLFVWRNDVSVRRVSRSSDPIDWPTHQAWLDSVLADPERLLLIGECNGQAVGVVRFDVSAGAAEVAIYLVPGKTGQGVGPHLLAAAEAWLAKHRQDVRQLTADVRDDNLPSHSLFRGAGYRPYVTSYAKRIRS